MNPTPTYFATPAQFRSWLEAHHETEPELLVGFHKKATGVPSITWPESVDEALCFGWIDGVRRTIDDDRYTIRFTPRRRGSNWSAVNVKKVAQLTRQGRMQPVGLRAYEARSESRTGVYSFEQSREPHLTEEQERTFRADAEAWTFFSCAPPSYRRAATWWVISAKHEATRERRLGQLIEDSRAGRRIKQLTRPSDRT
jgi:uncharacterized protein YdeI (YjbR/CyaY-like superfamily)